ncbi:MAG: hypothetical protein ACRDXE_03245 [Acidimicrobiales bacterium]
MAEPAEIWMWEADGTRGRHWLATHLPGFGYRPLMAESAIGAEPFRALAEMLGTTMGPHTEVSLVRYREVVE